MTTMAAGRLQQNHNTMVVFESRSTAIVVQSELFDPDRSAFLIPDVVLPMTPRAIWNM
jgi:hypothetical protein